MDYDLIGLPGIDWHKRILDFSGIHFDIWYRQRFMRICWRLMSMPRMIFILEIRFSPADDSRYPLPAVMSRRLWEVAYRQICILRPKIF